MFYMTVFIDNDDKVASQIKKHTQFKTTRVLKPFPI